MKKKSVTAKTEYVSKAALKEEFGWTDGMIRKFLPEPIRKKNPVYSGAAPMCVWSVEDVAGVMKSKNFIQAMEKINKQRAAREKKTAERVRKKEEEIDNVINSLIERVEVEQIELSQVRELAIQNKQYLYRLKRMENVDEVYCADECVIKRWMVNFLRHNCSNYDELRYELKNSVASDNQEAYLQLKDAVLNTIAGMYPELSEECFVQHERTSFHVAFKDTMSERMNEIARIPHIDALKALLQ